ncbi:MAG: serine hydrolase [marine benthic group bacterium]|nr:serine hydrolase [Gemmatimonadota bacterium]
MTWIEWRVRRAVSTGSRFGRKAGLVATLLATGVLAACGSGDEANAPEGTGIAAVPPPDAATREVIARIENHVPPRLRIDGAPVWTLGERMDRWNVEAVSVAVIDDYEIAWARAWGVADRETGAPATTETLFQAGSISKPVAATGALRLVENGNLHLDTAVNRYLSSWQLPENEFTEQSPVTIRRLLSHTAGTTVHGFPGYPPWADVPTVTQVLDGTPPANTAAVRVDIPPGSQVRYSGGGTTIVQLAMTDVSAETFPELLDRLVLEPAGMTRSTYQNPLPEVRLPEAAAGYHRDGGAVPGKRHSYPEMAAAGLWTTATDLSRFAIAMQNSLRGADGGVLRPETAREMITPVMNGAGLGFFIEERGGGTWFQHGGADEGFQALLMASADGGRGIAVMANSDNGGALAREILRAVAMEYEWDGFLEPPIEGVQLARADLGAYAGRYRIGPTQVASITAGDGYLSVRSTLQNFSSRLTPIGDDRFVSDELGARLRFNRDPDGAVTSVESIERPQSPVWQRLADDEITAVEHLDAGRVDAGLARLEAIDAPEDEVNLLGYALLQSGRPAQSVEVFRWNAERHPTHANPWDSLADAYLAVGDTAAALEAYRRVLRAIPGDSESDPAALENLRNRARSALEQFAGD